LFHGVDERLTRSGAIACASCHPGGAADSTTWQFEAGPRQSQPLWGGISDSAPYHWDSSVTTFADISTVTIQGRMGGLGLNSNEMADIAAFLDTIPAPAAPRMADGASVSHGAQLFASTATQCTTCHSGANLTDGRMHNVATGVGNSNAREIMTDFATPTLHGLAHSAPYLHDGSARTLEEFMQRHVLTDRMGKGSHLNDQDVVDMIAFLKSL
jgi:cytochrome c peroxidase